jgi:3-oxoacyl-[acyl-carrier-protein] synthase-3
LSITRTFKILGSGTFRPTREVTSIELDNQLKRRHGWVEGKSGVKTRRFAGEKDTTVSMAANAVFSAFENAGWSKVAIGDIDCIISASGTMEQAIPCTASLIQKALGLSHMNIPCFDINSTCLSFLTALDNASALMAVGRYRRILLVSSDIPSLGLNWEHMESSLIFGDGAAAFIIERSNFGFSASATVKASHMETYSVAANVCQVQAGGTKFHPSKQNGDLSKLALFEMDGKAAYKVTAANIDGFLSTLFAGTGLQMRDIDLVIPHQASLLAMQHLRKKLKIPQDKLVDIFADHGNQIAASIPTAFHIARSDGRVKPGDNVLLIGTGAGISLAGMILQFH